MRVHEILTEVWDNPQHRPGRWTGEAGVGGVYEKHFTLTSGKQLEITINDIYGYGSLINFYVNGTQQITGQGDAIQVFSIVGNAIEDFVRKRQPTIVAFSGYNANSRIKLYDRLVSRFLTLPAFRAYTDITDHNFEWPKTLENDIDDIQDITNQKLYVLAHNRHFKELYND
jgi:hypothetical protein